ncbi:hypothetical protein E2C01_077317 [Portunus trituberculatus]|uniref:Uncharacterized protein n=1 Tax=Portunus trituberculatus TaxID=210409 RepID=A0A5B7IFK3_PORTR|nr:hypothetical protein [Portunus trituberculatus]
MGYVDQTACASEDVNVILLVLSSTLLFNYYRTIVGESTHESHLKTNGTSIRPFELSKDAAYKCYRIWSSEEGHHIVHDTQQPLRTPTLAASNDDT